LRDRRPRFAAGRQTGPGAEKILNNNFTAPYFFRNVFQKYFFRIKMFSQKISRKKFKKISEIPGKSKAPLTL
jgi:hypothetical protein